MLPTISLGLLFITADTRAWLYVQPRKFVIRVLPEAVQQEWVERLTSHTKQNARALQQTLHTVNLKNMQIPLNIKETVLLVDYNMT